MLAYIVGIKNINKLSKTPLKIKQRPSFQGVKIQFPGFSAKCVCLGWGDCCHFEVLRCSLCYFNPCAQGVGLSQHRS